MKRIVALAVLAVLAVGLAGCGSTKKTGSTTGLLGETTGISKVYPVSGPITSVGSTTIENVATGTLIKCKGWVGQGVNVPARGRSANAGEAEVTGPAPRSSATKRMSLTHRMNGSVVVSCTSSATGTIQPGIALDRRIGPVSFAEPKPQVTRALGQGVVAHLDGHRIRFYPKAGIYVGYPSHPPKGKPTIAAFIVTRSSRYKTRSGVGVGSSLRQLRHRVKVTCYGGDSTLPPHECQHEKANINLPYTAFSIDPTTRRVIQIAVVPGGG